MYAGPDSAGAHPGPASYRKGGPLTVTDANLFLGRLLPSSFPAIFGPNEDQSLDYGICEEKFTALAAQISEQTNMQKTAQEVAFGFVKVANESMARAIRAITEARGHDTASHNLSCFGGAGGQHAAEIAQMLRIKTGMCKGNFCKMLLTSHSHYPPSLINSLSIRHGIGRPSCGNSTSKH